MSFSTNVYQEQIPALVNELVGIAGGEAWAKRLLWLKQELSENEHMQEWLLERCSIEWALQQVIDAGELRSAQAYRLDLPGRYELAAFAAGVTSINRQLSAAGRTRLRGQLLDGLKTDKGLLSLRHEISTAVHFAAAGFSVQCHDLENGGGFDYLVEKDGLAAEVECKLFSGDVGRRVHKRAQVKLFRRMRDDLLRVVGSLNRGLLLRISFPVRLSNSDEQHRGVCRAVAAALISGECRSDDCSVTLTDFDMRAGPFDDIGEGRIDKTKLRDFVGQLTGNRNPSLVLVGSESGKALLVLLESSRPDDVLGGIRRQLRDAAADQFTGTRPGILAAQIADLTDGQLLELAGRDSTDRTSATGLQVMTSDLLQAESRRHVFSVVYRGTPTVWSDGGAFGGGGVTYFMRNEFHPMAHDPRLAAAGGALTARPRIVLA